MMFYVILWGKTNLTWIFSFGFNSSYSFADGHGFFRHGLGVGHVVLHDGLKELIFILPIKRRLKREDKHWVTELDTDVRCDEKLDLGMLCETWQDSRANVGVTSPY